MFIICSICLILNINITKNPIMVPKKSSEARNNKNTLAAGIRNSPIGKNGVTGKGGKEELKDILKRCSTG